ncbi:MAG: cupredoxin domain-containing protein [Acidimicrobiales bacterium]
MPITNRTGLGTLVGIALLAGSACSVGAADTEVSVTGTDTECRLADEPVAAGKVDFSFGNEASDISELYVLRENGDVVGEVENVTSGTTRSLVVDLVAGTYLLRCKPGQTGDGITSEFTVTGAGGTPVAAPDRTIGFESFDFHYGDVDLSTIESGETIRFEMTNRGSQPHEFEVLDADGEALGEVAAMEPGASGGATITFPEAGTYTFQCILVDPETEKPHTELGMTGTFVVS